MFASGLVLSELVCDGNIGVEAALGVAVTVPVPVMDSDMSGISSDFRRGLPEDVLPDAALACDAELTFRPTSRMLLEYLSLDDDEVDASFRGESLAELGVFVVAAWCADAETC